MSQIAEQNQQTSAQLCTVCPLALYSMTKEVSKALEKRKNIEVVLF